MNILLILGIVAVLVIVIIISYYFYKKSRTCNKNNCDNLVTLGNWELGSETSDKATLIKKCTNIKTNIDGCSQLDPTTLTKEVNWSDITCNKACGADANGYKSATFENNKYTSNNTYPCNTEPCDSLVNFGNWNKVSETIDNITINRTCQNKNNTRDACSLIPNTDLNKTINWNGFNTCSDTKKFKFINIDNTTINSNTSYPCLNIVQPSNFKISLSAYSLELNNNDKISSWGNFTQTNNIYKPTYINDNNIIYVKFTGDTTNKTFLSYNPQDKNVNYGTGKGATFIVLARYNNKTQFNRIIAHTGNNNTVTRTFEWTDTHALFFYNNNSEISLPADYIKLNKFCLYIVRFTNDNKSVELFRNNVLVKTLNNYQALVNGSTDTYFVGCQDITGAGNNTDLIYTSIYERPLTNTELTNLYNSVKSICQD